LDLTSNMLQPEDSLDSIRAAHRRIEVELIIKAISMHRGNLTRVARELEVSRTTLYRKLRAYNLEKLAPPAADSCVTVSNHAEPWGAP
jgi:transcriptional regulator of acetoin/glycerol metabolism